ncbi:MAG: hypothetical protein OES24_23535 [Acidimicrobiia bacterium]|nr:hypothetical protein [Acidimicrobiia bacterium]
MGRYWLLDRHGGDGPTALVETDGGLHIIDVLRFGPSVTELDDQQRIWDEVIGRVAPTMKPLVDASSLDEEGVAPHPELRHGDEGSAAVKKRLGRTSTGRRRPGVGRAADGPSRKRSRGDR